MADWRDLERRVAELQRKADADGRRKLSISEWVDHRMQQARLRFFFPWIFGGNHND